MRTRTTVLVLIAALALAATVRAQPTAFTYQGDLKQGGAPADGTFDLRFTLFNMPESGVVVGSPVCSDNVQVADGRFTVTIDFGQVFATTHGRHIEIAVRTDTGLNCANPDGFVVLSPRQAVTVAPRAAAAGTAHSLSAPDGAPSPAVSVDDAGFVGIGTTTPLAELHIRGGTAVFDAPGGAVRITRLPGVLSSDDLGIWNRGVAGNQTFAIADWSTGTRGIFINTGTGNVGIGTGSTVPAARLDVRGDIRMGTGGTHFAARGEENLRILRGTFTAGGAVVAGTGWTATRMATGQYLITFADSYTSVPSVVATISTTAGAANRSAAVSSITTTAFTVFTYGSSGAQIDSQAHFIAIGPR